MKNIYQAALILMVCVMLLAGCGSKADTTVGEDSKIFKDVLGREVEIKETPKKIISLTPAVTEILFELGLDERIIGVTEYCNYPEAALKKPKMGDFANPNVELIVDAEPQIVFVAAGVQMELIKRLEQLGITVFCLDAESVDQVIKNIQMTGEIMGVPEAAQKLTSEMQAKVDAVVLKVKDQERPVVFFEVWDEPLMSAGPGTFINSLIELAGGQNLAGDADTRYPQLSMEVLFERDPDVYIANDFHKQSDIMARPGYENLTAVKTDRVHTIDDDLVTLPGPRVVLGLEEMARIIHPELFQ
ncbi:ABC transporter substrate-binding protein [Desulfitibacter alkalitolerans]|uniref:ABC transporter substrate-binding protein n=1 Tax=Desulfitibacter alkalitolerans TaxID=264641 RepID=UPI000482C3BA|nr:ABC transporter substrate-binding protein [Desulfitibacter alkalitolerans]